MADTKLNCGLAVIFCFPHCFVFMWVWQFLGHHKMAAVGGCFLGSVCFSFADGMWQTTFHATSCMENTACGCGGMLYSSNGLSPVFFLAF
jgi:hypothetical protein